VGDGASACRSWCQHEDRVSRVSRVSAVRGDLALGHAGHRRQGQGVEGRRGAPAIGISCPTPTGAFYVYPNLTGLLNQPLDGRTATSTLKLTELVLELANVAFVPGEAFGTPGYGRISYVLSDDDLAEGIQRIAALVGH